MLLLLILLKLLRYNSFMQKIPLIINTLHTHSPAATKCKSYPPIDIHTFQMIGSFRHAIHQLHDR